MPAPVLWTPYCGAAPVPGEWMARWNLDPVLLAVFVLGAAFYFLQNHATDGRQRYFGIGIAVLAFLFISPFCALTSALFSARTAHHILLTAIAAPLLVSSLSFGRFRMPGGLACWTFAHIVIFWLWHLPSAYAWALGSDAAYWFMQISLLLSACGFWAALLKSSAPKAAAALLAMMVQMGLLGALLTFSGSALYAPHLLTTQAWGMSPLQDQQLAGLIMWVPAAGLYLGAAMFLLARWFRQEAARGFAT